MKDEVIYYMKNKYQFFIAISILIILILFSILIIKNRELKEIKNNSASVENSHYSIDYNGSLQYLVTIRLDRQFYIYDFYIDYIDKIIKEECTQEEFISFIDGVTTFTQTELINVIYNILYEDKYPEILNILRKLHISTNIQNIDFSTFTKEELNELKNIYTELSYLFNRNHEDSFAYLMSTRDYNNIEFGLYLSKVDNNLEKIKQIFKVN